MNNALELIANIAEGSTTANSLQHIAKIARAALAQHGPAQWQKIECPICGEMATATDIPAAQRKPLTDEQIIALSYDGEFCIVCDDDEAILIFARAVEAAHDIKE